MVLNLVCLLPLAGTLALPGSPPLASSPGSDQGLSLAFAKALRSFDSTPTGFVGETVDGLRSNIFATGAVRLKAKGQDVTVRLLNFGHGTSRRAASNPEISTAKDAYGWPCVNMQRPDVSETYVNGPTGLHHWLTLNSRPAGSGNLSLNLSLSGGAVARNISETAVTVSVGATRLNYGGLLVWDAEGKYLPARMLGSGSAISIVVNDSQAKYPLTVDPVWDTGAKVLASDKSAFAHFGTSVALAGRRAIIGAPYASSGAGKFGGAAYIFALDNQDTWVEEAKITAADAAGGDGFGTSVALSDNEALIGAPSASAGANFNGAAYIFTRSGENWTQSQKLVASDGADYDSFGTCVAIDSDRAVIGAPNCSQGKNSYAGAAYAFLKSGSAWSQQAKLTPAGGAAFDYFGSSVALDGTSAIVGAPGTKHGSLDDAGAAYIFSVGTGSWIQASSLGASPPQAGEQFGTAVAISANQVVVGGPFADLKGQKATGAVYFFIQKIGRGTWQARQTVRAPDAAALDNFGASVAIQGENAIVGAPFAGSATANKGGAAYVFSFNTAFWKFLTKLTASDAADFDRFGAAVAMHGSHTAIGAPDANPNGLTLAGAAYGFTVRPNPAVVVTYPGLVSYNGVPGLYGGRKGTATISLTNVAPAGGTVVNLVSSDSHLICPSFVLIPAGKSSATVDLDSTRVTANIPAKITASTSGFDTGIGAVDILVVKVGSIRFDVDEIYNGGPSTGLIVLPVATLSDFVVTLVNSNPAALDVPATVTVPAGKDRIQFPVAGKKVGVDTVVKVEALPSNSEKSTTITVRPIPDLISLTLADSTICHGRTTVGTVKLAGPAIAGGQQIFLSSTQTSVRVPDSVTVPAGKTSATFTIGSVEDSAVTAYIRAYRGNLTFTQTLNIVRPLLKEITVDKKSVKGGSENATLTATLEQPAPLGGVTITLESTNPNQASVPTAVFIAAGARSGSTTITTGRWSNSTPKTVKFTGRYITDSGKIAFLDVTN